MSEKINDKLVIIKIEGDEMSGKTVIADAIEKMLNSKGVMANVFTRVNDIPTLKLVCKNSGVKVAIIDKQTIGNNNE